MPSSFNQQVPFPRPAVSYTPQPPATADPSALHPRRSPALLLAVPLAWFLLAALPATVVGYDPAINPALVPSATPRAVVQHAGAWFLARHTGHVQPPAVAFDPALVRPLVASWLDPTGEWWQQQLPRHVQPPAAAPFDAALVRALLASLLADPAEWFLTTAQLAPAWAPTLPGAFSAELVRPIQSLQTATPPPWFLLGPHRINPLDGSAIIPPPVITGGGRSRVTGVRYRMGSVTMIVYRVARPTDVEDKS